MGMLDWFSRKKPAVGEAFGEMGNGSWPRGVPLTEETIREASLTHYVYTTAFEGFNLPISDDDDEADWAPLANGGRSHPHTFAEVRAECRDIAKQPNSSRALKLYEYYIAGNDFTIGLKPVDEDNVTDQMKQVMAKANRLWEEFLLANATGFSFAEWVRRTYRDGEMFLRMSTTAEWPPKVRFIDPETIADKDGIEENGIVTLPDDAATYLKFLLFDAATNEAKPIPAESVIYIKLDTDSTVVRGIGRLAGVIPTIRMLKGTIRNEVIHRNLQSSIVLQRKVAGGKAAALGVMDHAMTSSTEYTEQTLNREKLRPGSIITTTRGVELEFHSPQSNFSDASPLITVLIQQLSATTGWSYEQISADTSQGNLASVLSQESPTLQMVKAERRFHLPHLIRLYGYMLSKAMETGKLEMTRENLLEQFTIDVQFGDPVAKDPLKDAQRRNLDLMNQTISHAEARRQAGVDSARMEREIQEEQESGLYNPALSNQNPGAGDMAASSQSNAQDGSGSNQGDTGEPGGHTDNQNAKGNQ